MPVTQRKNTLKQYQQLYQDIFNKSPLGIYTINAEGVIDSFNPKMMKLTGIRKAEKVIGTNAFEMGSYKEAGLDAYFKKGLKGKSFETEVRYLSHTGNHISYRRYRGIPIYNAKKEVDHLLLLVEDITKQKESERLLEERAKEISDLAKFPGQAPFPIMRIADSGKIMYANDASLPILNHWQAHVGSQAPGDVQSLLEHIAQTNDQKLLNIKVDNKIFSFVIAPFVHERYFNFYGRDITKEQQVDKMKSEFVTLASHQLRTPLTGIKWYAELLQTGKAGELNHTQQDFVNNIQKTNQRLIDLVNDLLRISQLEKEEAFKLSRNDEDIIPLIKDVVERQQHVAVSRQITITLEDSMPQRLSLFIDSKHIKETFKNIISNAIKYSPEHGVVKISFKRSGDNQMGIFAIHDNGMGIPEDQQGRVFDKFFRADNVMTAQIQGTGLGLYICREIIERHRGTVWFESSADTGTTFFIALPLSHAK